MLCTLSGCRAGMDTLMLLAGLHGRLHAHSMRCRMRGVRLVVHSATCRWRPPCSGGWVGFLISCQCCIKGAAAGGGVNSRSAVLFHWHHNAGYRNHDGSTLGQLA
jgi:hypothetical protein